MYGLITVIQPPTNRTNESLCTRTYSSFVYKTLQMTLPKKDEPLVQTISIRVTQSQYDAIKSIPDYREKLRALIQQWLENLNSTGQDES